MLDTHIQIINTQVVILNHISIMATRVTMMLLNQVVFRTMDMIRVIAEAEAEAIEGVAITIKEVEVI